MSLPIEITKPAPILNDISFSPSSYSLKPLDTNFDQSSIESMEDEEIIPLEANEDKEELIFDLDDLPNLKQLQQSQQSETKV